MNYLTVLHNGDPKNGSPLWMVKIWEDGAIRGEILTKIIGRFYEKDFSIENVHRFFQIPEILAQEQLKVSPHREEIIIYLSEPSGKRLCSFLLSDVPENSDLQNIVEELSQKISTLAHQMPPSIV